MADTSENENRENETSEEPEDYFAKLEKTVDETVDALSDELFSEMDEYVPAYSPEKSYTILSDMIRINALNNPNKSKPLEEVSQELRTKLLALIGAIIDLYDTKKTTLDDKSKKILLDAFTLNKKGLYDRLNITNYRYKYLMQSIPGKNQAEKDRLVDRHDESVPKDIIEHVEEIRGHKKGLNELIDLADQTKSDLIQELLEHSWFWDIVLGKDVPELTDILTRFLGEHPNVLYHFLATERPGLDEQNPKYQTKTQVLGLDHLIRNKHFGYSLIENVPSKYWDISILYSFMTVMLNKQTSGKQWEKFVQSIGAMSVENQEKAIQAAIEVTQAILDDGNQENYNLSNLIYFMRLSHSEIIQPFMGFVVQQPAHFTETLLAEKTSFELQKSLFKNLLVMEKGGKIIRQTKLPSGENWFWSLYNRHQSFSGEDFKQVISDAIKADDVEFLMHKKEDILSSSFPAYAELCDYFKNQENAFRFIDSFADSHYSKDQHFSFIQDFVTDPDMLIKVIRQENLMTHWANNGSDKTILSFFFDGDLDLLQNLKPRFAVEKMISLLDEKDSDGRTPWHYFCRNRSRLFFSKVFKALHPSLLRAATQADKDGNTPLSYIYSDLKFKKMIAEKIPAMAKLMEKNGISLEYVPQKKEIKEEASEPVQTVEQKKAETKTEPPPLKWRIVPVGNDKERKDPLYCEAIQQRVDELPPPQSAPVSLGNNRMKTKLFNAPTFKIWHNNTQWRVPFIKDDAMQIIFVMPGSDRSETYTNGDYCRSIRNFGKWIRHRQGKNPQYQPPQRS